jgi:hypothetical protein
LLDTAASDRLEEVVADAASAEAGLSSAGRTEVVACLTHLPGFVLDSYSRRTRLSAHVVSFVKEEVV